MQEVVNDTEELKNRIFPIVEKLFKGSSFYTVRLNEQERIEDLVNLFGPDRYIFKNDESIFMFERLALDDAGLNSSFTILTSISVHMASPQDCVTS